jgi:hypothetical protein
MTSRNKNSDKISISCSLIGTLNMMEKIAEFSNIRPNTPYLSNKKNLKTFIIDYNKTNSILLVEYLYSNSNIYLNRKLNRYKYFKKFGFAVYKSDFIDNDRVISEEAIEFLKENYANTEINS